MPTLVLLRHGQSQWNLENRFHRLVGRRSAVTPESPRRALRAHDGEARLDFDCCFTSVLTRAIRTLDLSLREMERLWLPVTKDWHLDERHYGGLTGLTKQEMIDKVGAQQVDRAPVLRRSAAAARGRQRL